MARSKAWLVRIQRSMRTNEQPTCRRQEAWERAESPAFAPGERATKRPSFAANWLALCALLVPSSLGVLGCEEKTEPEGESTADAAQQVAEAAPTPEPAAEAKQDAEAQAKLQAEEEAKAKEQAEVEANPLTACCRALGQRGFTERNPDYMKASKACGEAMTEKLSPDQAIPKIKKELGKSAMPSECG